MVGRMDSFVSRIIILHTFCSEDTLVHKRVDCIQCVSSEGETLASYPESSCLAPATLFRGTFTLRDAVMPFTLSSSVHMWSAVCSVMNANIPITAAGLNTRDNT